MVYYYINFYHTQSQFNLTKIYFYKNLLIHRGGAFIDSYNILITLHKLNQ